MPSSEELRLLRKEVAKSPPISSPLASPPLPSTSSLHHDYFSASPIVPDDRTRDRMSLSTPTRSNHVPLHGLGIAGNDANEMATITSPPLNRRSSLPSPTPANSTPHRRLPEITSRLMSPNSSFSGSTQCSPYVPDLDTTYDPYKSLTKQSTTSLRSTQYEASEAGLLSIRHQYDSFAAPHHCKSTRRVKQRMGNCLPITMLILAIFSTFFSGAFLTMALRGPRYGRMIQTNGSLNPASAAFLTSFMAKLIELSFVTVFIAFLGQVLARRVFVQERARGVTLAEISMRNWIMQPGSLFSQWESVRYAGITVLGIMSIIAALVAMLYTSAATALVQPQLRFPGWSPAVLEGRVHTAFANPGYIAENCKTPIQKTWDKESGLTCVQLEHAAQAYHNYFGYLSVWGDLAANGSGSSDVSQRPKGLALLNDNTTITAPWVDQQYSDIAKSFVEHGIVLNNVSMAMAHPGIVGAARDPKNDIMQPEELEGGAYNIKASVPSPVVHVLCATLSRNQLTPFVYELWPNKTKPNLSTWPDQLSYKDPYLNGTDLDDIFRWGPKFGNAKWPPVFPVLPDHHNTILNDTVRVTKYGRDSIYILGRSGESDQQGNPTDSANYALCQLKVSLSPKCSTHYNATSKGASLAAVCEDESDDLRYEKSITNSISGNDSILLDWPNIASEWARSIALNYGELSANGSNSRLLTQLLITNTNNGLPKLNPTLPSMAEALAVMAGCTLLQAAQDAPFVHFWNYTQSSIQPGVYQAFNASIRAQQYASGGTQPYQKAFIPVLFIVFLMNCAILVYFIFRWEWYTDFSEPGNLFSIAVNSPPSKEMAGSCGGGIEGKHFRVSWKLSNEGEHVYMESKELPVDNDVKRRISGRQRWSQGLGTVITPLRKRASEIGKKSARASYSKPEDNSG